MNILSLSTRSHVIQFHDFALEHKRFPWNTIASYNAMVREYKETHAIELGIPNKHCLRTLYMENVCKPFLKASILTQGVFVPFVFRTHQ